MNIEIARYILQFTLIFIVLYMVGRFMTYYINKLVALPTDISMALAPIVGLSTLALQLSLYSLIGIKWSLLAFALPWIIAFALKWKLALQIALECKQVTKLFTKFNDLETYPKVLVVAGIVFTVAYLLTAIILPLNGWDSVAMWLYKAKVYFESGGIVVPAALKSAALAEQPVFNNTIYSTLSEVSRHQDYPPLFPLMLNVYYVMVGQVSEAMVKSINIVFMISFVASFCAVFRRRISTNIIIPLIFSFLAIPLIAGLFTSPGYFGYADFLVATMMGLSLLLLVYALMNNKPAAYVLTIFFAVLAALSKNEGQPFLIIILIIIGILCIRDVMRGAISKKQLLKYGLISFACMVPVAIWVYIAKKHNISSDLITLSNIKDHAPLFVTRLKQVAKYAYTYLTTGSYIILLLLSLLGLAIAIVLKRPIALLMYLIIFMQICFYVFIYLITPYDLAWHLQTSFDRLVTQLTPAIFIASAAVFVASTKHEILRNNSRVS